ncbi:MAG: YihY/virulence factor BrkB family protein [Bacteroidales bacterium]|nr:YihY/virulence factor BrkB family protein [Bacteroidales bacterium]
MFLNIAKLREKTKEWGSDMEKVPGIGKIVRKSKTVSLPGLQGMPVYDVMDFFFQSMGKGVVFQRAAAITYRFFVALLPMIIALFSTISYMGEGIKSTLLSFIESMVPAYVWPAISNMITELITRQDGTLSSVMTIFGIYFTVVSVNSLLVAMNTSYFNDEKRKLIKQIGLSFMIMLIGFLVVVVVLMLFIMSSVLLNHIHARVPGTARGYFLAIHGSKWILTYAAVYFLVSIVYYLAPVKKNNYKFFSAGSSACTILMVLLLWLLNIYFSNFSNYNLIYGSLGAIFAILLWINWTSVILLIGFDLNVSIAKAKKEKEKAKCEPQERLIIEKE